MSLPTGINVVSLVAASKWPFAGSVCVNDLGAAVYNGKVRLPYSTENTNRIAFALQTAVTTFAAITASTPFTAANGDQLEFDFFTEIQ
jgi:hypothetical protein